ncbi:hypothetical protein ABH975_005351 [Bradyrhizobium ottawaense]
MPAVAVRLCPVFAPAAISLAEPWAETEPSVGAPPEITVCARMKPLSALTLTLPASPLMPVAVNALKVTLSWAWMVCVPPLCAVWKVMLPCPAVATSVVPTLRTFQLIGPAAVSRPEPVEAASVLPLMVVAATRLAEPWAETEPIVVAPPEVTVCARMKPVSAVTLMLPASPLMPVAVSALKVTLSRARMVSVPPLCAVWKVMPPWLAVAPSVVPTLRTFQLIGPAAVSRPEPVEAASVLPLMVVAATRLAEPWAETEPYVVTPPDVTVCARMKPVSAVTLMLPTSPLLPVAASDLNVTFWVAWTICEPLLSAVPMRMLPLFATARKDPLAPVAVPASTWSSLSPPVPMMSTLPFTADSRLTSVSARTLT